MAKRKVNVQRRERVLVAVVIMLLGTLAGCATGGREENPQGHALIEETVSASAKAATVQFDFVLAVEEPAGRSDLSGVVALAGHDKSHITIEGTRKGAAFQCTIIRDGRVQRSSSTTHPEALNATLDVGEGADRLNHGLLRNLIREGVFLTIFGVAIPEENNGAGVAQAARVDSVDASLWTVEYQTALLSDARTKLRIERGSLIPRSRTIVGGNGFTLTEEYRAFKLNEPLGQWFGEDASPSDGRRDGKR